MTEFQERVVEEYRELRLKCEKLNSFISHSQIYPTLSVDEQVLLRMQLMVMKQYASILTDRIIAFQEANNIVDSDLW
jgi:hypothetical protein